MARTRNLKPGFFRNETLAEVHFGARLLFAGLWTIADREGKLEDRPRRIKADVFPYDSVADDKIHEWLEDLSERGFILRYEVSGKRYISLPSWAKHQNPHHKEQPSTIPGPDKSPGLAPTQVGASTNLGECKHQPRQGSAPSQPCLLSDLPSHRSPGLVCVPSFPERFPDFWEKYPRKMGEGSACQDWISCDCDEHAEDVFSCLGRYLASEEVRRGVVMNAGSNMRDVGWIVKCHRDGWRSDWPGPREAPKKVDKTMELLLAEEAREKAKHADAH